MKKTISILTALIIIFAILMFNSCEEPPTEAPEIITEITGKVFDKKAGTPLSGVQITTLPVTSSIITGSDGSYTLTEIAPGNYKVTAQKDGYNTNSTDVSVAEGKTVSADILLDSQSAELKVNPETLDFDIGQTNLTFNITNTTKVGEVTWSIGLNQPWLSVSPSSGSTTTETDIITVVVNRDSLEFGNYSALITINSDFGSEQVNVIMVKANPNAPQITVTPAELDFGIANDSKTLLLKNTGTGTLTWTATTNESWLILSSGSGSTTGGNASSLTISVNKSGLSANNYTGMILINSNGGSQVVDVSMTVQQGTLDPPELQIIGDATKTSIPLGWTKVNDANFSSYKLYRSIVNNVDENSTLVTTITNSDQNTYTDEGLNSGTVYYYKIYVYSKTNIGSASNEVSATTSRDIGSWASTETISSLFGNITTNSMHIISENDIWLCGGKEIWHYNGSTWSNSFTTTENINFRGISFVNSSKGYAIDNNSDGSLYEYSGINWTKVADLSLYYPKDIITFSESNIWILGKDKVYHYNGTEWSTTTLDIGDGVDLDAISENDIWALGGGGKVFHYNGVGWAFIETIAGYYGFNAISVISNSDIWITQDHPSNSQGGMWHYNGLEFNNKYKSSNDEQYYWRTVVKMIFTNEGWSAKRVYNSFSYFDGNGWKDVANPVDSEVKCIKFLTRDKGWAVTHNGTILRYVE